MSYQNKKCILCSVSYAPKSGSQKACNDCKEEYQKYCIRRWNKENPEKYRELNRKSRERTRNDPAKYKLFKERQAASKKKTREKYGPRYRKMLWKRNKARHKLTLETAKIMARCAICNDDWPLQCHHIDHNPNNDDISNLQWLCKDCHHKHHHN